MPAEGVTLIFGYKLSESQLRKIFRKHIDRSSDDETEFDIYNFSEVFLNSFLKKIGRKHEIKFEHFYPPCCAYRDNKFIVLGISICYFSCYDFGEIVSSDIRKIQSSKKKIKKLEMIFSELGLDQYCDSVPKFYSVGDDCPRCT
jgi:DNA-directed RNA polymerase subunit N (RpoN/RPB10)